MCLDVSTCVRKCEIDHCHSPRNVKHPRHDPKQFVAVVVCSCCVRSYLRCLRHLTRGGRRC